MGANTNEIPANPKEIAIANNITASIDMSINLKTSPLSLLVTIFAIRGIRTTPNAIIKLIGTLIIFSAFS